MRPRSSASPAGLQIRLHHLWGALGRGEDADAISNGDASSDYVDFIKTDPHMFAQVEGCTNLPELKTHDVEDLD